MSYRMVQTLKDVDLIAAEDTRNTGLLAQDFEIGDSDSFHEHNAQEKIPDLIAHLESGKDLAAGCRTPKYLPLTLVMICLGRSD